MIIRAPAEGESPTPQPVTAANATDGGEASYSYAQLLHTRLIGLDEAASIVHAQYKTRHWRLLVRIGFVYFPFRSHRQPRHWRQSQPAGLKTKRPPRTRRTYGRIRVRLVLVYLVGIAKIRMRMYTHMDGARACVCLMEEFVSRPAATRFVPIVELVCMRNFHFPPPLSYRVFLQTPRGLVFVTLIPFRVHTIIDGFQMSVFFHYRCNTVAKRGIINRRC